MKTKAFLPAIVFLLASLASCNSSVPKSLVTDDGSVRIIENPDGPLYICDLKAAGDTIDIPLSELVEDCRIVRFETSDEALFKAWWIEVSDNYICVRQQSNVVKLYDKDGKFLCNIGAMGNVTVLCVINSIFYGGITLLFLDRILFFFGASHDTLPYARDFMQIILIGSPVTYVMIGLNNIMRATGYPRKAMLSSMLTVGCNIILAPVFIFWLGWGIRGAATATILSQFAGMIWVLSHFMQEKSYIRFKKGIFKLRKRIVENIFSIGMSPFLMNVCASAIVIIFNKSLLLYGGDLAIGAYGILNRLLMLFVMVIMGLTMGMQPIVGYNHGAHKFGRVKQTLKYCMIAGGCITSLGFVFSELFPNLVVNMFTDDKELTALARTGLQIGVLMFPFVGIQIVISSFFQSIGKAKISIFLSLSRQLLYLLPCLLLLPHWWGLNGIWLSMPVSDLLAFITACLMLAHHIKKLNKITEV